LDDEATRQERREKKLRSRRERILKHGRELAQVYRDAVMKRAGKGHRKENK